MIAEKLLEDCFVILNYRDSTSISERLQLFCNLFCFLKVDHEEKLNHTLLQTINHKSYFINRCTSHVNQSLWVVFWQNYKKWKKKSQHLSGMIYFPKFYKMSRWVLSSWSPECISWADIFGLLQWEGQHVLDNLSTSMEKHMHRMQSNEHVVLNLDCTFFLCIMFSLNKRE